MDGCPRTALREMIALATDHGEVGDVAALELEVLRLCKERQKLIVGIVEGETRLAELRGVKRPGGGAPTPEPMLSGALGQLPPPTKASLEVDAPRGMGPRTARAAVVPVDAAREEAVPTLRWTTVYGSAGQWMAGVTDGTNVWYVRAGDPLPSGIRVVSVRERPPGVRVGRDGAEWQVPGPEMSGATASISSEFDRGS